MNSRIRELTLIALFPAMMGATAGIVIPLGGLPPITLQTIFVFMAGLILGPKDAGISIGIYVLLGAIGLPIFSGYRGGIGVLLSGSGGFIVSFVFAGVFVGFMKNVKIINNEFVNILVILFGTTLLIYMIGGAYISYLSSASYPLVLGGFYTYLIGDILKIVVVIIVYMRVRSHVTYERS